MMVGDLRRSHRLLTAGTGKKSPSRESIGLGANDRKAGG